MNEIHCLATHTDTQCTGENTERCMLTRCCTYHWQLLRCDAVSPVSRECYAHVFPHSGQLDTDILCHYLCSTERVCERTRVYMYVHAVLVALAHIPAPSSKSSLPPRIFCALLYIPPDCLQSPGLLHPLKPPAQAQVSKDEKTEVRNTL